MGPLSDIRVLFFGDSFTAGTGDPTTLGWVGRVCADALAHGHNLTAYNLGVRRETSNDILRRYKAELTPRVLPGADVRVVFLFGANDTAVVDGQRRVPLDETLANARLLLQTVNRSVPVLMIGSPPVDDEEHNRRISELSVALARTASTKSVPYLDVYTPLRQSRIWREEVHANDGSHPRARGYSELAALIQRWPAWWFYSGGR